MTPAQCRASRSLLGWTEKHLAQNARVGFSSVADFELQRRPVSDTTKKKMQVALEDAGIKFTNAKRPGIKMR